MGSAIELMEAICVNPQIYNAAADKLRFGTDAEGSFLIKTLGKLSASLGFEYKRSGQSGVSDKLNSRELAKLIGDQSNCQKDFKPILLDLLVKSTQRSPKVITIDSKSYPNRNNVTNANAIAEIFRAEGLSEVDVFDISPRKPDAWEAGIVRALNPEVIFLHWSAFETSAQECTMSTTKRNACNQRFFKHFAQFIKQTDADFVIYTRTRNACKLFPRIAREAVDKRVLESSYAERSVIMEMTGPKSSTAFDRNGRFTSTQSQSDVAGLYSAISEGGIDRVIELYNEGDRGICNVK